MKTRKPQKPDEDAEILQRIIQAMMQGMGRGGLTWMAAKLGTTPSNLRKRMMSPSGAFDAMTLRASLLVLASKAERFNTDPISTTDIDNITIETRDTGEEISPTWKPK